jgi:homoserine kinase
MIKLRVPATSANMGAGFDTLGVAVGLYNRMMIEEIPENLIMCLCPTCAHNFYGTGSYFLRKINPTQKERDICTYCNQRPGFDYEVIRRNNR